MKIATGIVVNGEVVLRGEALAEGAVVTVFVSEEGELFAAPEDDEYRILAAMGEADRGEMISWDEFRLDLQVLMSRHRPTQQE